MNTNNRNNNDDGKAVLCPSGCGGIVRRGTDPSSGKNYYTDIGIGEKHCCGDNSQNVAVKKLSKPQFLQFPNFKTAKEISEENTEKANQAISRIEFIKSMKSLLDFGNKHILYEEGEYRLILDEKNGEE